ncbi:MAG: hypothetical protein NUV57_01625, partial [archaeon]|nr:hypothetical protein [archaeon]
MKKSIERKILERMPIMALLNFQEKEIAEIFNLPKSTVSLLMTEKLKKRNTCSHKNLTIESELDTEVRHHWIGSWERE